MQVFPLRDGKMIDRYGFHLENVAGEDEQAVLEAFVIEYYGTAPSIPPQVFVPAGHRATPSAIAEFLSERRGARVDVRAPLRGEKRRLVDLAVENARLALDADTAQREAERPRRVAALEELREVLNLESLPVRIECFDVSNIQGESIVASMVVFSGRAAAERALPQLHDPRARRAGRRRRDARGDHAALRAGSRGRRRRELRRIPNLVVVDGGKGQLAAARAAMEELDLPRVAVIALAKREEEVFVPGVPYPIALDRTSPALQLLQQIRDEAHRVALRHHRQKRDTKAFETIFETLPGIGPLARRAILKHFGSVDRFLEASQEELEGVPGLPQKTARGALRAAAQGRAVLGHVSRGTSSEAASRALFIAPRNRIVRSVTAIAVNPATTFVADGHELHPDAEREELRARHRAAEDVEQERLLGADAGRA